MKDIPFEEIFEIPLKNGLTKPKKIRGEGFKMVNMGELFSYSRMINIPMDRVPLTEKEKESFLLKNGDLLFARQSLVREGAGQCSIFLDDYEKVCFESHLIRCRLDKEKANPLFYYYYFRSRAGKLAIDAIVEQGAGAAGIRGSDLKKLMVPDVDKAVQDSVANNIDSIDRKIELNRQINQTLESMAQAIFKSWFVNFDPVKAKIAALESGEDAEGVTRTAMRAISGKTDDELDKMEGGQPEDYARLKTTAELFPAAMHDSELGEVPKGWEVKQIGDVVNVVGGGTPSTKNSAFWDGGSHCWTTPKDLSGISSHVLLDTVRKITDAGLAKISCGLLPVGTFLLSSRAPVGYTAIANVPLAVNQGYIAIPPDGQLSSIFLLHWTRINLATIKGRACGTTFQEISKKNFRPIKITVPTVEILTKFDRAAGNLFERIVANEQESRSLIVIRDILLPKLVSGKIRVAIIR